MSRDPRDEITSASYYPTEDFPSQDHDQVGPLDLSMNTFGNHEAVEGQWTHVPDLSGHETSNPFVDAVSDLPLRNHVPPMDRSGVPMNPYGRFSQGPRYPTDPRLMTTMAGYPSLDWPSSHVYYGAQLTDPEPPRESRRHSEENLAEAPWTPAAHRRYEYAPPFRFRQDVQRYPLNGLMPECPRDGENPGATKYAPLTVPRSHGVDQHMLQSPIARRPDPYITPMSSTIQASPVYHPGNTQQAMEGSAGKSQSNPSPTIALDPGTEMPAGTRPGVSLSQHQGNAHHVFDQKMLPTRKRKRRQFSPSEKEHIKNVRRVGACSDCKLKKCKCIHAVPSLDRANPQTPDSDVHEPITPESDPLAVPNFSQEAAVLDVSFDNKETLDLDLDDDLDIL
ncbi:MAG: hypothetical protein LQ349_005201 [Xanthoria aureola]|nr:MAG: hypothetical protein LQ349_005201 [Xanthoria aureola]